MACIYALADPDGAVRYVGKTGFDDPVVRVARHLIDVENGSMLPVHNWLRHHPHQIIVLEEDPADLDEAEMRWIAAYREADGPRLLNLTSGGDGHHWPMHEDVRRRIAESLRGHRLTDETKRKIGNSHRGRKHSEVHVAAIAAANRGKTRSPEARARMSEAAQHRKHKASGVLEPTCPRCCPDTV